MPTDIVTPSMPTEEEIRGARIRFGDPVAPLDPAAGEPPEATAR